ncbi:MAG: hypothetical protein RBR14_08795 [Candidatus Cloacimonas acidaminovorans]|nr:hypothetical protein [Candidatus Cloacimonas acidaminovorans]
MNQYAKGIKDVLKECEEALQSIIKCQFQDCKCAPNDSDFDLVRKALWTIAEYKQLRNIK